MSRVTIELGATVPLPHDKFSNIKPMIRVEDIDPEGDVEGQVARALEAARKGMFLISDELEVEVKKLLLE